MYTLRPYQSDAIGRILACLGRCRSCLLVLATGLGKTVVFATVVRDWRDGRCLIVAHRDELIQQAAQKIEEVTGERPGIEMGEARVGRDALYPPRVVVTSVQTMSRPNRHAAFNPSEFGLVVIDEAHHAVSQSYRTVIGYFRHAKILGVTATPKRADDLAMGQICDEVAYDFGIEAASEEGWLVPIRQKVVTVESLDFSRVRTIAGDFNEAELEAILTEETILHSVAKPTVELAGERSTIVFCVTVAHAKLMADVLNRYKPKSADWISGETPMDQRRAKLAAYKSGRLQFLCNVAVLIEGFDAPNTAAIAMARPTKSLPLYVQVIGRATRALPGVIDGLATAAQRRAAIAASGKPDSIIFDYAGNAGRHKIVSMEDVLGGKWGSPVRQYARKTAEEEGHAMLVEESLERADDELAFIEEQNEWLRRREKIRAEAEYRTQDVDPFSGQASRLTTAAKAPHEPATDKQVWLLVRLGVRRETAEGYSKKQAGYMISKLKGERGAA